MIQVNWDIFYNETAESFNVYRSLPGFVIAFPNELEVGDTLTFAATSPVQQSITFTAVDIDSIVAQFNAAALGARAAVTEDNQHVIFRATARRKSKFKLFPCTFATDTDQAPRTIVPGLEWAAIGNVPLVAEQYSYRLTDVDGTNFDMYRVTSVATSVESLPSFAQLPQLGTASLCAVEGRVADSANRPVVGLKIQAQIRIPMAKENFAGIDGQQNEVFTDQYGRFTIYLTQGRIYLLQIPAVGYNETVRVPCQPSVNFLEMIPTTAADFSPFGDPN